MCGSSRSSKPSMSLNLNGAKPSSSMDLGLAALGSLSARDFIDQGLAKANGSSSASAEEQLGQISARAFIGVGIEEHAKAQSTVDLGQLSARKFIGLGLDAAGAAKTNSIEDFAQLTGDEGNLRIG